MNKQKYKFEKPVKRFDMHVHLSKDGNKEGRITVSQRLVLDEILGIEKGVILPYPEGGNLENTGDVFHSEEACQAALEHPDHFYWFGNVHPDGSEKTREKIIEYKDKGAKGVGEFGSLIPFDDERVDHMLSVCEELDLPFLFHISPGGTNAYGVIDYPGLPLLEKALQRHPNVIFIGHSQPFWYELGTYDENLPVGALNGFPFGKVEEEGRVPYLMRTYPNLYADLSANSGSNAILRDEAYGLAFLNEFQDRIVFGSDLVDTNVIFPIGQMLDYYLLGHKISEEVYRKICWDNAMKLLKIAE